MKLEKAAKTVRLLLTCLLVWAAGFSTAHAATAAPAGAAGVSSRYPIPATDQYLGMRIYEYLREGQGNFVFSPYSIATALRMLGAGAKGQTARELAALLRNPVGDPNIHAESSEITRSLYASRTSAVDLEIGNALWMRKSADWSILDEYSQILETHYLAKVELFGSPTDVVGSINRWVSKRTNGRIGQVFDPATWNPSWDVILINAVHFKAEWQFEFDPAGTQPMAFHLDGGRSKSADMMILNATLPIAEFPEASVLELPYAGRDFRMIIVLPRAVGGLARIEKLMLGPTRARWIEGLKNKDVTVLLPRFRIESDIDLRSLLSKLGAPTMFKPDWADFSGIAGPGPLWVDAARHQALLKVDEEGTEADASTRFMLSRGGPTVFRADHPFLFWIFHRPTGLIFFMGRVVEPK